MNTTVPIISDTHVRAFAAEVVPDGALVEVTCKPLPGAPERDCFPIVSAYTATHGGEQVLGWVFWEWPGVYIEAEFHAVWRSPEGDLFDLTPNGLRSNSILFISDPQRKYDGCQVQNIRKPLVKDADVSRFLQSTFQHFAILNRGDRAYRHEIDVSEFSDRERKELDKLTKERVRLLRRLEVRYSKRM